MSFLCLSLQGLSLKAGNVMGLLWFSRLILIVLVLIPQQSLGCPSGCRCYSLTVECGSLGIKEIPQGVPFIIEVSRTNGNKLEPPLWVGCSRPNQPAPVVFQLTSPFILSYYLEMIVVNQFPVTPLWCKAWGRGCAVGNYSSFPQKVTLAHTLWSSVKKMFNITPSFPPGFRPSNITAAHEYWWKASPT